jgi:hypothetical protein
MQKWEQNLDWKSVHSTAVRKILRFDSASSTLEMKAAA